MLSKNTTDIDTHAYIIIRQKFSISVIANTYHSLYGFACVPLNSTSTIALYLTLSLRFHTSFIVFVLFSFVLFNFLFFVCFLVFFWGGGPYLISLQANASVFMLLKDMGIFHGKLIRNINIRL